MRTALLPAPFSISSEGGISFAAWYRQNLLKDNCLEKLLTDE
jgi:hypothetical protein